MNEEQITKKLAQEFGISCFRLEDGSWMFHAPIYLKREQIPECNRRVAARIGELEKAGEIHYRGD